MTTLTPQLFATAIATAVAKYIRENKLTEKTSNYWPFHGGKGYKHAMALKTATTNADNYQTIATALNNFADPAKRLDGSKPGTRNYSLGAYLLEQLKSYKDQNESIITPGAGGIIQVLDPRINYHTRQQKHVRMALLMWMKTAVVKTDLQAAPPQTVKDSTKLKPKAQYQLDALLNTPAGGGSTAFRIPHQQPGNTSSNTNQTGNSGTQLEITRNANNHSSPVATPTDELGGSAATTNLAISTGTPNPAQQPRVTNSELEITGLDTSEANRLQSPGNELRTSTSADDLGQTTTPPNSSASGSATVVTIAAATGFMPIATGNPASGNGKRPNSH